MSKPTTREIVDWLRGITRPVHGYLAASITFRVLNLTLDIALFAVAAGGVMHVLTTGTGAARIIGILAALAIAKGAAYYLEQFMGHHVAFKAVELLREHIYDSLWPKAPAIVTRSRSGEVFATLTRDVDRIDVVYAHTIGRFVSAYIVGVSTIAIAVMWAGLSHVGPGVIALALSLFVVPYLGMRRALGATAETLTERAALAHHLTDTEFGIREVLGYGRETRRLAELDDHGRRVAAYASVARRIMGVRRGLNLSLAIAATAITFLINLDALALPAAAALAGGTLRAFEGARAVEDATGYFDHALAAARRLWALSHTPARVNDGPRTLRLSGAPTIDFSRVHYTHPGAGGETINGVSLTVPAGSHVAIVGRSGSGKSTLVNLLQRYDDPTSGQILLDGEPVTEFTLESLRSQVVAVSQRSELMHTSIAENLRLGARQATDDELWWALGAAGLADEVRAMPDGLGTIVGESASALSGGQAQRICLARALLMRPRVLILDEFAAHLNVDLEERIWAGIRDHLNEATVIEVTHRLPATARADRVFVLDGGQIADEGSPQEITPQRLEEIFRQLRRVG